MDEPRVKEIYDELEKLVVTLARDPVSLGPAYLQDLISTTRGYLNQTSNYLTEVLREQHSHEMTLTELEAAFQVSSDDLMAHNRQVSSLPAIQDRIAMVNVLLAEDRRKIIATKKTLKNLGLVEKVIRHRHKELENTMSAIRLQRSLVETELRTGSFYGDENDQSRGSKWGKPSGTSGDPSAYEDLDENEINRLLREAEEELESGASEEAPKGEPENGTPEETSKETVEAKPAPQPKLEEPEDDDITRFLNQEASITEDMFKDL